MTLRRPSLVIFDCDGVLIDSEAVASRVVAAALTALGWTLDATQCHALFLGMSLADMVPLVEARVGPLPEGWRPRLAASLLTALAIEARPMPGAADILRATSDAGLPWRVASNSSHAEMAVKFAVCGLSALVGDRAHSAEDVARGKPAPDVFLAAAAAENIPPADCLVIEDSKAGVAAARAAGMACVVLAPDGRVAVQPGVSMIRHLAELRALLGMDAKEFVA